MFDQLKTLVELLWPCFWIIKASRDIFLGVLKSDDAADTTHVQTMSIKR
jgi:hypothetical protein